MTLYSHFYFHQILKGKEWCCGIVKQYPDIRPLQTWGDTLSKSEYISVRKQWDGANCNRLVGGSDTSLCDGKEWFSSNSNLYNNSIFRNAKKY